MPSAERVRGFLQLIRPKNAFLAAVGPLVGWTSVRSGADLRLALAVVVPPLVLMAGNSINDFYDLEIDRVNKPWRPIPRGIVHPREAVLTYLILTALAVSLAAMLGPLMAAIALLFSLAYFLYAARIKATGLPGNALVSLGVAFTLIYGALAAGQVTDKVLYYSSMAFTANMAREIAKTVEDLPGDSAAGLRTFPIVAGIAAARMLTMAFTLATIILTLVPAALGLSGTIYKVGAGMACLSLVVAVASARDMAPETASRVSNLLKLAMTLGILSMLLDNLAC